MPRWWRKQRLRYRRSRIPNSVGYAIVPVQGRVESVIAAQARLKARALVEKASAHMALERQSLPEEKNRAEVERIADELVRTMPADFWTEK